MSNQLMKFDTRNDKTVHEFIQTELFKLGFDWPDKSKKVQRLGYRYIYVFESGGMSHGRAPETFTSKHGWGDCEEISLKELHLYISYGGVM